MIKGIHHLATLGIALLLFPAASFQTRAAEQESAPPSAAIPEAPAKAVSTRPYPFSGKIASLDKKSMTVTLEGKEKLRVLAITSQSKFTKLNKPAVFDDMAAGDEVGGQVVKNAAGKEEVVSLRIGAKVPVAAKTN